LSKAQLNYLTYLCSALFSVAALYYIILYTFIEKMTVKYDVCIDVLKMYTLLFSV